MHLSSLRARAAILLLVLCGLVGSVRVAVRAVRDPERTDPPDVSSLDRRFASFVPHLPTHGRIGWVPGTPPAGVSADAWRWIAHYALAPRVILPGPDADWVLVGPGEAMPGADRGGAVAFELVESDSSGLRLYRRTVGSE